MSRSEGPLDRSESDERAVLARAWGWASSVMVIAAEMVVPGLIGFWIDSRLGTLILFGLIGFGLGVTVAIMHLMRMVAAVSKKSLQDRPPQS